MIAWLRSDFAKANNIRPHWTTVSISSQIDGDALIEGEASFVLLFSLSLV